MSGKNLDTDSETWRRRYRGWKESQALDVGVEEREEDTEVSKVAK